MPGPESVRGYLDAVEAQIRWKRARTVAARELETHLEDQQEEFLAEGHPPEEAERLAVEDMGDPVAVGADLDRLHRPRPQWGMLGLTLALLLVGGWLRYALTRAGAPWDEDLDPLRCALSVVTGAAVLVGAYFLDVSRLLRWAKWVYIGAVMAGVLSLHLSPNVNNASYFTRYVVLFYPAVYALWLYACRGKGWRGLLAAVAGGIPLTVVCMCAPFIQGMIQLMVIGCFLLLLAIQMDWFTVPRRQGLAAVGGLAAVMAGAVLWMLLVAGYNAARIQILLHPEIDPQGAGYQAVMARRILGASRLMGKGGDLSIQPQTVWGRELLPEMMLPEWNHDFLPTTMVYKLGWLPYLLLLAVLAVLLLWMLRRCACQQSQSGKLLALAVVLTLAVQSAFAAALNKQRDGGFQQRQAQRKGNIEPYAALGGLHSGNAARVHDPVLRLNGDLIQAGTALNLSGVIKPVAGNGGVGFFVDAKAGGVKAPADAHKARFAGAVPVKHPVRVRLAEQPRRTARPRVHVQKLAAFKIGQPGQPLGRQRARLREYRQGNRRCEQNEIQEKNAGPQEHPALRGRALFLLRVPCCCHPEHLLM